jgi:hypothetical protein
MNVLYLLSQGIAAIILVVVIMHVCWTRLLINPPFSPWSTPLASPLGPHLLCNL